MAATHVTPMAARHVTLMHARHVTTVFALDMEGLSPKPQIKALTSRYLSVHAHVKHSIRITAYK